MANPQIENGHTRIANEILEQIMQLSLNGTQFRLVMAIWRYTYGFQRKHHELSISFLAEAICASRSQVDRELKILVERNIIRFIGRGVKGGRQLGFNKKHTEWSEPSKDNNVEKKQVDIKPKETKKDEEKPNIHKQVIEYLNKKANKRFSHKSAANQRLINGRLAEGRTLEEFIHVIDVKCEQWLDDSKMNDYLRPATLFAQTNFENYVNQKRAAKQIKQSDPRDKEIEFQQWLSEGRDPSEFDWS